MVGWCCNGMSDVLLFMKSYMIKNADFLGKSYVSLSVHYLTLATLFESVLPVYTCEMFYFVWSLIIIILVHHYWLKISQKTVITFFFIVKVFFLKQNSFLHLWLLLIFVSLAVFTVALFTGDFTELVYNALAPWKKKKIRTSCNLFIFFVSFLLNVIVFVYSELKQSLIQ